MNDVLIKSIILHSITNITTQSIDSSLNIHDQSRFDNGNRLFNQLTTHFINTLDIKEQWLTTHDIGISPNGCLLLAHEENTYFNGKQIFYTGYKTQMMFHSLHENL